MKPISLEFKCFGPYINKQFIDFRKLERGGIFLISGDTGSGKTTILDAMCTALYGKSSGGMRESFESMRCAEAENDEDTYIEFIFENNSRVYKFTRALKFARKRFNDEHGCAELIDGVYVPLLENATETAVNKKAVEIIGLTVEQFRQVIILPQGKFETLLTADSAGKEQILTQIFGADKWDNIVQSFTAEVKDRDSRLKEEKFRIDGKLEEYGCENFESLCALETDVSSELEELQIEVNKKSEELSKQKKLLDRMNEENRLFAELDRRQAVYDELARESESFKAKEELLKKALEAEKIRSVNDAYQESVNRESAAQAALSAAMAKLDTAKREDLAASEEKERHDKSKGDIEAKRREVIELTGKREVYAEFDKKQDALEVKIEELDRASKAVQTAESTLEKCEDELVAAKNKKDTAQDECTAAENRYFRSIGESLAAKLENGVPCPVCGSVSHPAPAKKTEDYLSEEEYNRYKKAKDQAEKSFERALSSHGDAQKAADAAKSAYNKAVLEKSLAAEAYTSALKLKIRGLDTSAELENAIKKAETVVSEYDKQTELLQSKQSTAAANLESVIQRANEAKATLKDAQALMHEKESEWAAALQASVFDSQDDFLASCLVFEEREEKRSELEKVKSDFTHAGKELEAARESVKGKLRPDTKKEEEKNVETEKELTLLQGKLILCKDRQKKIRDDIGKLTKSLESYTDERAKCDADLEFARRISGSTGVGLKRYVLGVMLTKITAGANLILRNIYGGRYRLFRTDDASGQTRRAGLELEVFDTNNGERRNVRTLSGGEKFLVALSLAIGLSNVVQSEGAGVRLEAMFVDEGFGSLSREALNDAVEILQSVQNTGGTVGIISHVEKLVETIPNRIDIVKTKNGSECRMIYN